MGRRAAIGGRPDFVRATPWPASRRLTARVFKILQANREGAGRLPLIVKPRLGGGGIEGLVEHDILPAARLTAPKKRIEDEAGRVPSGRVPYRRAPMGAAFSVLGRG